MKPPSKCEACGNTVWVHEVRPLSVKCLGGGLSPTYDNASTIVFVYNTLGKSIPYGLQSRYNKEIADAG